MIHYYQTPNGYVGITDEYPKGLKGVIFIGRGPIRGGGLDTVQERAYSKRDLKGWVPVDRIPRDWQLAIGFEKPAEQTTEQTTELVVEWPWERLRKRILAKPGTPEHAQWQHERVPYIVITIIALILSYWSTFGF